MMKKITVIALILLAIFPLARTVYLQREHLLLPFDLKTIEYGYNLSHYAKPDGAWIADEILFAYASWKYINGDSPIMLNPENPPLGKYIVGLSIILFNNEKLPNLVFQFLSLYSLFILAKLILKSSALALIPPVLLSWEKLFLEQLIFVPLFETFSFTFLCLTIYFYLLGSKKNKYFILSSVFLGLLWATRPWMATVPLILSFTLHSFLVEKNISKLVRWIAAIPVAVVVLLASYHRLLISGASVYKVLSVQKWILWYHQSRLINIGTVWPLLYLNRWYVWWGDQPFIPMPQWNVLWPMFTTLALFLVVLIIFKKIKYEPAVLLIIFWVLSYLIFLSIGNVSSRYIIYLAPFCYILGIYLLKQLYLNLNDS